MKTAELKTICSRVIFTGERIILGYTSFRSILDNVCDCLINCDPFSLFSIISFEVNVRGMKNTAVGFIWAMAFLGSTSAFYVPGVAPTDFRKGDHITVKAIKMTSSHTQLPFEYYSLPFCPPKEGIQYKTENLGEILRGDRISTTAYELEMNESFGCRVLCGTLEAPSKFNKEDSETVLYRIEAEYFIHLIVDNLPCATQFQLVWLAINFFITFSIGHKMDQVEKIY